MRKNRSFWRPIKTAPKDGTHVLLTNGEETVCGYWGAGGNLPLPAPNQWWVHWQMKSCGTKPTHWMPLPAPPTIGDRDG